MQFEKAITLISEFAPPVYLGLVVILALIGLPFFKSSVKNFLVEYVGNVEYGKSWDSKKPIVKQKAPPKAASAGSQG
jgi:hypothetical protein